MKNMANMIDHGLGFQVKVLKTLKLFPLHSEAVTGRSCMTPPASSGHVARTPAMFVFNPKIVKILKTYSKTLKP